jgi:ketosteroid isomerase-like protein
MADDRVAVVMEVIRSFVEGDRETPLRIWHPDAVMTGPAGWPEPGPFEGRENVLGQFERLAEDWGQSQMEDVKILDCQGDWVILSFRWETRGGRSGVPAQADFGAAYKVRDGRILEAHFRWNTQQALEAAGLD